MTQKHVNGYVEKMNEPIIIIIIKVDKIATASGENCLTLQNVKLSQPLAYNCPVISPTMYPFLTSSICVKLTRWVRICFCFLISTYDKLN